MMDKEGEKLRLLQPWAVTSGRSGIVLVLLTVVALVLGMNKNLCKGWESRREENKERGKEGRREERRERLRVPGLGN